MEFTEDDLSKLFVARIGFLTNSEKMPYAFLDIFPTVQSIVNDPQAQSKLQKFGFSTDISRVVQRWAKNLADSERLNIPEYQDPQEVIDLGVSTDEVMIKIGITYPTIYVLAHTESQDLQVTIPKLSQEEAEYIIVNAKTRWQQLLHSQSFRQTIVLYESPEGEKSVHVEKGDIIDVLKKMFPPDEDSTPEKE